MIGKRVEELYIQIDYRVRSYISRKDKLHH